MRYVERNPLRAGLVKRAEQWLWSSARQWDAGAERPNWLAAGPVERPRDWLRWVNAPATMAELEAVRKSVTRGTPFGNPAWTARTAAKLRLEATLRPRGRPRKDLGKDGK